MRYLPKNLKKKKLAASPVSKSRFFVVIIELVYGAKHNGQPIFGIIVIGLQN